MSVEAAAAAATTDFLNDILTDLSANPATPAAFRTQNTLYAICILLQAAITSEAIYSKGLIAIDDTVYECKGSLPKALIDKYGFCTGDLLDHSYDERVAKDLFWPVVTLLLEVDEPLIDAINARIESAMAALGEHNYYGQVIDTAELKGEWLEKARQLFGLAASAVPAVSTGVHTAEPKKHAATAPALLKHTRRTHGRRALTPPRSGRSTAYTRHRK